MLLLPSKLVLLLSSALPLRSRYLPRDVRLPRTASPDLSCLRAPPFHPFGHRLPAILLPRPVLSIPTFVSSFSSPLAPTPRRPSLSLSFSLCLSPRYTISHACIRHLVLDTPRLADSGRLALSFSISLALPLLDTLRPVPSLPRSLTPVSSLSSRVRNSHRFAYVRSYRGRTSLHPPPLGRPLAPPTASTSPLLRALLRSWLSLSLSLPRSSTHTPRTHHPLVLPFSYFPLLHETRTLSSDYRSSSLSADVCRLDDCHALLFNPCRHPALDFLRRIFAKFENVMLFLFFFFEDFSRIRHAFVAIRRHLNPPTKIYVLHWKNLFP